MKIRVPKSGKRVRDSLCSQKRNKLHNCHIDAEVLGQSHTGSLAAGSVSVNCYELGLVESMNFLVVTLELLPPPTALLQGSKDLFTVWL